MRTVLFAVQSGWMHEIAEAVGWTLVHFIWQGTLVAVVLGCVLALTSRRSAQARYVTSCVALLALVALPCATLSRFAWRAHTTQLAGANFAVGVMSVQVGADDATTTWALLLQRLDASMPWLMLGWCVGVAVFSCRLIFGIAAARNLKLRYTQPVSVRLQRTFEGLRERLLITRAVALLHSARVTVPTVVGWLKPVVLLPVECLTGLSDVQIAALLAHELAHIRRNDYLVSVLQSLVETVLFYHPAVWWVSRQLRREREYCCDELAVAVCGDRVAYARALSALEEQRSMLPETVLGANGGVLMMRIKRLLGYREEVVPSAVVWVIAVAVVIAGGGSMIGRLAFAEPKSASVSSGRVDAAGGRAAAAIDAAAVKAEAVDAELSTDAAEERAKAAVRQLQHVEQELAEQKDLAQLSEADRQQMDRAQKAIQQALQQLNSDQLKMQGEQLRLRLNSPEFRKQIEQAVQAAQKVNSDEVRKALEDARKNIEESRGLREDVKKKIDAQLNSPEFRKQLENAKAEAAKVNSPEFRRQMAELKKQLNSPEFRKQLENAKAEAAKVNSPEFRSQMEELKKQLNSPEFRKQIEKVKSGVDAKQLRKEMKQLQKELDSAEFKARTKALRDESTLHIEAPSTPKLTGETIAMNGAAVENGQTAGPTDALRVSGAVMAGQIVKQVPPVYPPEAKAARIQGTVTLKAVIGKTGTVEQLSVVSGPSELVQSAMDAVRQWQYKPFLLNGNPVEVQTTINVNYTFSDAPSAPAGTPEGNAPSTSIVLPKVIYKVDPQYTAEAKAAKVKGVVVVGLTVTPDGLPANVHLVRSVDPGLDASALEAVRQYRFKAARLNGTAVEKDVNVEVNFQVF